MFVTTRVTFVREEDGFDGSMTFTREIDDIYELADYNGDVGRAIGFSYLSDFVAYGEDGKAISKVF
jgi:hypothetical protein